MDGRKWWNQYTPLQLRCEGYKKSWRWRWNFGRIPFISDDFHFYRSRVIGLDMTENRIFNPMSYDNLSSVFQNVLKFYRQLTGEEMRIPFIFDDFHFCRKLPIKFQNILRNTTQVIIRYRVKILFSVISSPITLEWQKWKLSKMKGILLSSPVSCW
jgi:hypothetical protein